MYYGELEKIRRLELYMQTLAYASIGLDFLVAVATIFAAQGNHFFNTMLFVGGGLLTLELIAAGALTLGIFWLRHYKRTANHFGLSFLRTRYRGSATVRSWVRLLFDPE